MYLEKLLGCLLLASSFFIQAETINLSGTVKKTGATAGLSGVKVSLAKIPAISATTNDAGTFTLSGSTAITSPKAQTESLPFTLKKQLHNLHRRRSRSVWNSRDFLRRR
jgi:hypothetical protein